MITVTFPIPKGQIKTEIEKVRTEISARQAELRILQTIEKTIRDMCSHEFKSGNGLGTCIHCAHYVGSGD